MRPFRNSPAVRSSASSRCSTVFGAVDSTPDSPSPNTRSLYQNVRSMWWTLQPLCDIWPLPAPTSDLSTTSGYLHLGDGSYLLRNAGRARKFASASRGVFRVPGRLARLRPDARSDHGSGSRSHGSDPGGRSTVATRSRAADHRPPGRRRAPLAATILVVTVGVAACGGSPSASAGPVKACQAIADAYNQGFLPGSGDGSTSAADNPTGQYYTFFLKVSDDMSSDSITAPTDSNGVPSSLSRQQILNEARAAELTADIDQLSSEPLPLDGSITAKLAADCEPYGVRWKAS